MRCRKNIPGKMRGKKKPQNLENKHAVQNKLHDEIEIYACLRYGGKVQNRRYQQNEVMEIDNISRVLGVF